jgi:hypothetical protein
MELPLVRLGQLAEGVLVACGRTREQQFVHLAILACLVPFAGITTYDAERAKRGRTEH